MDQILFDISIRQEHLNILNYFSICLFSLLVILVIGFEIYRHIKFKRTIKSYNKQFFDKKFAMEKMAKESSYEYAKINNAIDMVKREHEKCLQEIRVKLEEIKRIIHHLSGGKK